MRTTLAHVLRSWWNHPDKMVALMFHHYLGDRNRAAQIAKELRT